MYEDLPETLVEMVNLIETMPGTFRGEFQLGFWGGVSEGSDAWSVRFEADIEDTEFFVTAHSPGEALKKAMEIAKSRFPPAR